MMSYLNEALKWGRKSPNSSNNFDLVLLNVREVDFDRLKQLLNRILGETHRGLTLSSRASQEFQRWFEEPDTPLKSYAYVLLSNWFMTQSGDRNSLVASGSEELWDALFPCRPKDRLSSPEAGRNHVMVPAAFESFWRQVLEAQGKDEPKVENVPRTQSNPSNSRPRPHQMGDLSDADGSTSERVKAAFRKGGLDIEVEGSPHALADFLRIVSSWEI
jgi:hypothetical protein